MTIKKLEISRKKLEINLKFYFFLKYLVKLKLSTNQVSKLLENSRNKSDIESFIFQNFENEDRKSLLEEILLKIENKIDLDLFIFSLKLYTIKDLLLNEAKIVNITYSEKLRELNPLSLEYDNISLYKPYTTRVNGALLSLLFFEKIEKGDFNFMSKDSVYFLEKLGNFAKKLLKKGIKPNQIFMLMFSESVNQSIISDSGNNYEERILSVLEKIGISREKISKTHDKNDKSTEFYFFFELNGKTYGIGAKRTLRERYKQFIKTSQMSKIDVMIQITLGLDLNEEKAKTILNHGVKLFVSDEVYKSRKFLQKMDDVYSVKSLNVKTLKNLIK